MKYHYCEAEGSGKQVCSQDPAPQNPVCKKFLEKNRRRVSRKTEEILILHSTVKNKTETSYNPSFCFKKVKPKKAKYGWCVVKGNYYNLNRPMAELTGWGYCSKDCYLDPNEGPNKLRIVDNAEVNRDIYIHYSSLLLIYFHISSINFKNTYLKSSGPS